MFNLYRIFEGLKPDQPLQMGEVINVDGDLAIVRLPGGGTVRARGTAATGQQVFVRGDVIQGEAPSLTRIDQEV